MSVTWGATSASILVSGEMGQHQEGESLLALTMVSCL